MASAMPPTRTVSSPLWYCQQLPSSPRKLLRIYQPIVNETTQHRSLLPNLPNAYSTH
eukprot:c37302_g1_i1 orf=3-170(-)